MKNLIKFKGFDKKTKKMKYISNINFDEKGEVVEVRFILENKYTHIKNVELLRWTGLNDKNKKEIYEGDIVRHFDDEILLVKWIKDESRFYCLSNYGLKKNIMIGAKLSKMNTENIEVIGNIYENPELFKKDNHND